MIGFMLDSARLLERRDYYRRFIDFIADRGADTLLLHFSDDQGCSLRFDAFPQSASPNAYTHDEMRKLVAYARDRGITIIPELASLGHTRYLTFAGSPYADLAENAEWYSSICPVSGRTRTLVAALLDEALDIFDSPIIHVGLDEVNLGGHPLTQEAMRTQTEAAIFGDYLNFLHARLAARGRQMMMWGDYLIKDSAVIERIPRDVLIANWQYDPGVTPDATRQLLDAGFKVIQCPALISHNQPICPGESFAYPNLRRMREYGRGEPGLAGMITTIWTPTRFISETLWPAIDYAAAIMRRGPGVRVRDRAARLGSDYFGMADIGWFADAAERLAEITPRRSAWNPVLELDSKHLQKCGQLNEQYDAFVDLAQRMHACHPLVTASHKAFTAILLQVDLLAHAWRRALAMRDGEVTTELIGESQRMAQRLSAAWKAERFDDDPRMHTPVTHFDEGDHLLYLFDRGTKALVRRGAAVVASYDAV